MFKRSDTLVFSTDNDGIVSFNFLSKSVFQCSQDLITLLNKMAEWVSIEQLMEILPGSSKKDVLSCMADLIQNGAVIARNSSEAKVEQEFLREWTWGIPAAMLHFGVQDNECLTVEAAETMQIEQSKNIAPPALHLSNSEYKDVKTFENPIARSQLLELMAKRRTNRNVLDLAVSDRVLTECLFAGLGIVGYTENCVGKLPLSMTPSGGARNPFEAYVYVRNVDGLKPGFYHYSASENSLGLISTSCQNSLAPSELVGNQIWMNDMSALVFLVAHLDRSMWKYKDPNAYRVVLIEAGHIGQNIMLAATDNGLTACPSAALCHSTIKDAFAICGISKAPVYALGIGHPVIN